MDVLTQKAYLVGVHRYSFRAGEVAEIIGLRFAKPKGYDWRLAYEVEYFDGKKDFVSLEDVQSGNVVIISDLELSDGKIPEICK